MTSIKSKGLVAFALCAMLAACGGNNEDNNTTNNGTTATNNGTTPNNGTTGNNTNNNGVDCSTVANACDAPGSSCDADNSVVCAQDANGCLVETTTDCTASSQVCMGGACTDPGACTDDAACAGLADGASACSGDTLVACAMGADGCLDATSTDCAAAGGTCDAATNQCVTSCTDDAECAGLADGDSACLDSGTTVSCALNADGCLEATTTACGTGETCDDSGAAAACVGACADAIAVLSCADAGQTITGDTANGTNVLDSNACSPGDTYDGNEAIYVFADSGANEVSIDITYDNANISELDAAMLTGGPCDSDTLTCSGFDFIFGSPGNLTFEAAANEAHYLVLEPYSPTTETTAFGITITCTPIVCGDGAVAATEACDDGNMTDGDGCSSACEVEAGYLCDTAEPSVCTPDVCGDGILSLNESCDDNNLTNGDGCSDSCTVEFGYECDDTGANCAMIPDAGSYAAGATIADITGGAVATGEFEQRTITFTEPVLLSGTASVTTTGDVDFYLFSETSTIIQADSSGDETWTDVLVPAGTYIALVYAFSAADGYTVTMSSTALSTTDIGTFAAGDTISDTTGGALPRGDSAFHTVTFSTDVMLTGSLTSLPATDSDLDLYIRGANGTFVTFSAADGDETFSIPLLAGTYLFEVNSYTSATADATAYTLALNPMALALTDIGTFAAGDTIADTVGGAIAAGESAYYTITFSTDVSLDVLLNGNTTGETGIYFYDTDSLSGSFTVDEEDVTLDLTAGKYIVRIISNLADGAVDAFTIGLTPN